MEEILLPGLLPGDPQNRLSESARRRVVRAHLEAERIRWEAEAKIEGRHLSEEKQKHLRNQADLKGTRVVLNVLAAEYDTAGFTLREYWDAMRNEIDSATNSLSLNSSQARMLVVEFHRPPDQKPASRRNLSAVPKAEESVPSPKAVPVASQEKIIASTNRERIDQFISRMGRVGTKVKRKDIWQVAGYTDRTEFERFQRGDNRNQSAVSTFNRVLGMEAQDFLDLVKRKRS